MKSKVKLNRNLLKIKSNNKNNTILSLAKNDKMKIKGGVLDVAKKANL